MQGSRIEKNGLRRGSCFTIMRWAVAHNGWEGGGVKLRRSVSGGGFRCVLQWTRAHEPEAPRTPSSCFTTPIDFKRLQFFCSRYSRQSSRIGLLHTFFRQVCSHYGWRISVWRCGAVPLCAASCPVTFLYPATSSVTSGYAYSWSNPGAVFFHLRAFSCKTDPHLLLPEWVFCLL